VVAGRWTRPRRGARALGALAACLWLASAGAVERLELVLGPLEGAGWSARRARVEVRLDEPGRIGVRVDADALRLPESLGLVERVRVECPRIDLAGGARSCAAGTLAVDDADDATRPLVADFSFEPDAGGVALALRPRGVHAERLEIRAAGGRDGWRARLEGDGVALADLERVLGPLLAAAGAPLPVTLAAGTARLRGRAAGGRVLASLEIETEVTALAFSDASGLNAAESLDASARLRVARDADAGPAATAGGEGAWRFEMRLTAANGILGIDPFYVEPPAAGLALDAAGRFEPARGRLALERLAIAHPEVIRAEGAAVLVLDDAGPGVTVRRARLRVPPAALAAVYPRYLEPLVLGTPLAGATIEGHAALDADWGPDGRALRVVLDRVGLAGAGERFAVAGLSGTVRWRDRGEPQPSGLGWTGGRVYAIEIGAGTAAATLHGDVATLDRPLVLDLLDGRLEVAALEVRGLLGARERGGIEWRLTGALDAVSLERLTAAFDWVPFAGTLSGKVPAATWSDGVLRVDGALTVKAFDGDIAIEGLRVERPFGVVPRLAADVRAESLSLAALTGAFAFGNITGRLDGEVRGLLLEDWSPRAFDARLATPPGDPSPHRISQRAVENLASLGGSSGALSSVFLRFFEEFSYDRLGLSCRLRDGVCRMGGVAPVESDGNEGFYIVRGGGVPRIDVIGYRRRVDWRTLVERLEAVTAGARPVIR